MVLAAPRALTRWALSPSLRDQQTEADKCVVAWGGSLAWPEDVAWSGQVQDSLSAAFSQKSHWKCLVGEERGPRDTFVSSLCGV
jgi:hypothetical protein